MKKNNNKWMAIVAICALIVAILALVFSLSGGITGNAIFSWNRDTDSKVLFTKQAKLECKAFGNVGGPGMVSYDSICVGEGYEKAVSVDLVIRLVHNETWGIVDTFFLPLQGSDNLDRIDEFIEEVTDLEYHGIPEGALEVSDLDDMVTCCRVVVTNK